MPSELPACERCATRLSEAGPHCIRCGHFNDMWFAWRGAGEAPVSAERSSGIDRSCPSCQTPLHYLDFFCPHCGLPAPAKPVFAPPPSVVIEGVVERLRPEGFDVRTDSGGLTLVTTMTDGGPDGDRFASGAIRAGVGDRQRDVPDRPR
jgi:hypothetical protein